ncbi:F-box only protein 5 [Mastacembelus armatus]|uniref:F-box protein 5 n=1 Tax=Mastacembelus armatus TaxID=205130 RepID=A0A3Q3MXV8_9TELE|nr:F-box only protein 5 [Mastacembelus armatus]
MFDCKQGTMKCPGYEATRTNKVEKSSSAEFKTHLKASPVKAPTPIKPECLPGVATLLFSLNNSTKAVHNKENSTSRTLHRGLEDSGYLSLNNSQIEDHHGEEENAHTHGKPTSAPLHSAIQQENTVSPNGSPSKCHGRDNSSCAMSLVAASSPVYSPSRRTAAYSLPFTPSDSHNNPNLPIVSFQRAVCEELAKSYRKNKRYDWSIIPKVAEDHLLDRVIGGQMGCEYVDIFTSLLCRNMRRVLTNILALLGDMDLISCKKVSRTWRKIICDDTAALSRCQRAEEALRESRSSERHRDCGLTRDVAVSRVVLSCMQTLASSNTYSAPSSSSSSSTASCRVSRRTATPQKGSMPNEQCTRFKQYVQAASNLKQHESLHPCRRCGSPATHSTEAQRAMCTRSNCLFDFCTRCKEAFHGSTPCRTVQQRSHFSASEKAPIIAGSARSKRNVRRL